MKGKIYLAGIAIACLLVISSCSKDGSVVPSAPHDENTGTAIGTSVGTPVVKTIGTNGGEVSSADGRIKIIIPAGALSSSKEISIQSITNQLPSGIGNAYRITPHGEQFSKSVTLVFKYKPEDTVSSIPEFLDIAYQDDKGTWQAILNSTVNKVTREISVTTTHFSDWTYFKSLKLEPASATVQTGDVIELKVTTTFPRLDPDDMPAGSNTAPVYTSPRELRPDEIKGWSYSGEGSLDADGSKAIYQAPDHLPSANPEAVAVNINLHRKGQFMLLANITVLGNAGVRYLKVDEDYPKKGNEGKPRLYLYGSFGTNPGAGKGSVKINGTEVEITLWSPSIIACAIDRDISGPIQISANNKVIASSVLRKFKGIFLYTRYQGGLLNSGNPDALKETTKFTLVYRGFGAPCPADINQLFTFDLGLANKTIAEYSLSGKASVTAPASPDHCAVTTSVSLPGVGGLQFLNPFSVASNSRFKCYVTETAIGIQIKIDYILENVEDNVIVTRTDCSGTSHDPARTLNVGFEGFNMKTIDLRFIGTDELSLNNVDVLNSPRMASNILIEAWDNTIGAPTHYEGDGLIPATFRNWY
jgi:hypothetical protein